MQGQWVSTNSKLDCSFKENTFPPHRIYNIDESGLSTVPTKLPKVLSPTGTIRVAKMVSSERGENVTVVCSCNAGGDYVPPFVIFPRQRMLPELQHVCPPGTDVVARKNGWMTTETFIIYLAHFVRDVRCSDESKVLLLVDNNVSHVSLDAINFCRSHGIVILEFPPHTTYKLQLLDVSFFGPLKTFYSQQCDNWMVSHPGNAITDRQVAQLLGEAYNKAATA